MTGVVTDNCPLLIVKSYRDSDHMDLLRPYRCARARHAGVGIDDALELSRKSLPIRSRLLRKRRLK